MPNPLRVTTLDWFGIFYFPYTLKESEMMLMKKITFNALLNHKAHNYKPMQIEVEKVIPLYGKRFEQMRDHPLDDKSPSYDGLCNIYKL